MKIENLSKNMNYDLTYADREKAIKITAGKAYILVKTGVWNLKTFEIWFNHVICEAEAEAKWGGC